MRIQKLIRKSMRLTRGGLAAASDVNAVIAANVDERAIGSASGSRRERQGGADEQARERAAGGKRTDVG